MIKHFKRSRKCFRAWSLVFVLIFSLTSVDVKAFTGDYIRSERKEQPQVSHEFAKNELGVVNFTPVWGDKEANIDSMEDYIEKAHKKGVKILLFPEMCVTGYVASSDPDSKEYKWAVESAEEIDGPTQRTFSKISDVYDMYIIYGSTQKIEGDTKHAYNSAFVCSPEGDVTAYQKITPVEGEWCEPGDTPVIIDAGEYGKIGISICFDTYSTPELERYYSAMGCNLLMNPTASGGGWSLGNVAGWQEYYRVRLESIASRDGYTILSSNLSGYNMSDGSDEFPGGSVIMNGAFNGARYYAGAAHSDGKVTSDVEIVTGTEGLLTNSTSLTATTGSTCSDVDFNPELYVKLYKELGELQDKNGGALKYSPETTDGPVAGVVNMTGYWGNKKKTKEKMIKYIEEAAEKKVDILVFPETVLSGYGYLEPEEDPFYHKYGVSMQVATAETIPGDSTNELSAYAKKYNMYIIFGMTEKDPDGPMYDSMYNNSLKKAEKVYNSAAILYPDGKIESYRKIHRAGNMERQWTIPGDTPKIIETKWGKAGIDICRDGHFYPELGRYYAAKGCTLFIHPTATTGNAWYRATRIGSYTDRDNMAAITSNLLGGDGIYTAPGDKKYDPADDAANFDDEGNFIGGSVIPEEIHNQLEIEDDPYWDSKNWTYGDFNSTSIIITKGKNGSRLDYNGTGSASEGFEKRGGTSPLGLEVAKMDLTGTGFNGNAKTFRGTLYAKMYDRLALLYRSGYQSVYGDNAVAEPVTVKAAALNQTFEEEPSDEKVTPVKKTINVLKLTSFKKGTKKIAGKTLSGAIVKVKIAKKTYTVKADKNGKFKIKLTKKLKKSQKIKVTVKKSGYQSKTKTFTVK